MTLPSRVLLLVSCSTLVACAGQTYRANVGPLFVVPRGEAALRDAAGGGGNQNSLDGDLGLGNTETVPYVRLQTDYERHRVRLHGFGVDAEGAGTLNGAFGNLTGPVSTSLEFYAIVANYGYELLRDETYRVAVGVEAGFYALDVSARSTSGREEVETSVLVPMPFVEAELFSGPVTLGANIGIMAGDFGDGSGRYWDAEAYARWQATERFDVLAGYRYLLLDAYGRASSRDFDADVDLQGVFISAGIRF